jgi:hypothetical protein
MVLPYALKQMEIHSLQEHALLAVIMAPLVLGTLHARLMQVAETSVPSMVHHVAMATNAAHATALLLLTNASMATVCSA